MGVNLVEGTAPSHQAGCCVHNVAVERDGHRVGVIVNNGHPVKMHATAQQYNAFAIAALWGDDTASCQRTALSLAYEERSYRDVPHYGAFAPVLVRHLRLQYPVMPPDTSTALKAVKQCLSEMLRHQCHDLRGMANMNYSFLSGSLYLNVLGTCRDIIHAIVRLHVHEAQQELFNFLVTLMEPAVMARVNKEDGHHLTTLAANALASLPARNVVVLTDRTQWDTPSQQACLIAVLMAIGNHEAIPCVLQLLHHHESPRIKAAAADTLGRIGTHREYDDLLNARQSQSRQVRMAARAAIQRIRFRQSYCAYRHLLRPAAAQGQSAHEMLRPAHAHAEQE